MNIDLKRLICGLDGKPFAEDATLGQACSNALWNPLRGDEAKPSAYKVKCASLALRIAGADSVDLSAEDIVLIKERIDLAYAHPGIVLRVHEMLDPPAEKAEAA